VLKNQISDFEYNPKKHNAMIIRRRNPQVTFMLFSTGSCIATGAKSEEDNRKSIRQFMRQLQKLGHSVRYTGFQINSVSGAFDVGCGLDLSKLADLNHHFSYNPETFAGGILRYEAKKTLMVFHTGSVTMAGSKSIKEMSDDYPYILYLLHSAKKQ
jgi:transcription initiation factor TFIID TATA-box-binding protein